jgi:hypothetical protein
MITFYNLQWNFYTEGCTCSEGIFASYDNIFLHLKEHTPTIIEVIGVLIADMTGGNYLVEVTTTADTYSYVSMMVPASVHAWLVGKAHCPRTVVAPEGITGNMTGFLVFLIFQIHGSEILPGIVIVGFISAKTTPTAFLFVWLK